MISLFSGNYIYLLTYKKPGTVLGMEATEVHKTKFLPCGACILLTLLSDLYILLNEWTEWIKVVRPEDYKDGKEKLGLI